MKTAIVTGGTSGIGLGVAKMLLEKGNEITVVEMAERVDLFRTGAASDLLALSEENHVTRLLGWKLCEITDDGVRIQNGRTGEEKYLPADTVLMAVGRDPARSGMRYSRPLK